MSNNAAGRGPRPLTMGRKNWTFAASPRRDDRSRHDVDEVDRDQATLEALLGEVTDATEVVCVAQRDHAGAVLCCALAAELHRLAPDDLTVAAVPQMRYSGGAGLPSWASVAPRKPLRDVPTSNG